MPSDRVAGLRRRIDRALAKLDSARESIRKEEAALEASDRSLRDLLEAQDLVQRTAEAVQNRVHQRIAEVVSECLSIFDEPYRLRVDFRRSRGRTEARLVFERDELEVDPLSASGGGVVDVAAFALRLACLLLRRPPLRRVLVLDEPFRYVSAEYRGRIRGLLEILSRELSVQIVLVTHDPGLRTGQILPLS